MKTVITVQFLVIILLIGAVYFIYEDFKEVKYAQIHELCRKYQDGSDHSKCFASFSIQKDYIGMYALVSNLEEAFAE